MATTYDVILSDGTGAGTRARKDAAVKLGQLQGQPFTVVTSTGVTVHAEGGNLADTTSQSDREQLAAHSIQNNARTEAPAPADTTKKEKPVTATATKAKATKKAAAPKATEDKATAKAPAKTGPSNELEFTHGAKYFVRPMTESAAGIADREGLALTVQAGVISISGGDAKTRKAVVKEVDQFLTAQYAAFKEWKRTVKDKRAEWYGSPEGRKAMTAAEVKFFNDYATRYLAGEVDEAEGVI